MGKSADRIKRLKKRLRKAKRKLEAARAMLPKAAQPAVSPLAPAGFPALPPVAGVRLATAAAGVRYRGRDDVMLAQLAPGTAVAGVFTRSATRAAPVLDCQDKIGAASDEGAAILVNSGNANAFTGAAGTGAVATLCKTVARVLGVPENRVYTASTGVIGEPLPEDLIAAKLDELSAGLTADALEPAARAIMTTDTYPKGATRSIEAGGQTITLCGIAKGSGMIAPDMATMLAFVFTDARISQSALQRMLDRGNAETFNCITVDSDTSTSDTLLVAATGQSAGPDVGDARTAEGRAFQQALTELLRDLAHQVVRDGEGASKFAEIRVTGAASDADAHRAALAVANSPLVKTALAGEDPNWGRIVMAVGKSGARANRDALSIRFGDILVAQDGFVAPGYSEDAAAAYMKGQDLEIEVGLGIGNGTATVWTCDLTHRYIDINADYRS